MSMNLNAQLKDGSYLSLRQTPTQISYTILPPSLGTTVKGKKAKEAMIRYMEWVKYSLNGSWENLDDLKEAEMRVSEHIEVIEKNLDNLKTVYIL